MVPNCVGVMTDELSTHSPVVEPWLLVWMSNRSFGFSFAASVLKTVWRFAVVAEECTCIWYGVLFPAQLPTAPETSTAPMVPL